MVAHMVKKFACNAGDPGFNPEVMQTPWRREWQPTSVFLPGDFHEQKNLAGYSPWGPKELDMAEQLKKT